MNRPNFVSATTRLLFLAFCLDGSQLVAARFTELPADDVGQLDRGGQIRTRQKRPDQEEILLKQRGPSANILHQDRSEICVPRDGLRDARQGGRIAALISDRNRPAKHSAAATRRGQRIFVSD